MSAVGVVLETERSGMMLRGWRSLCLVEQDFVFERRTCRRNPSRVLRALLSEFFTACGVTRIADYAREIISKISWKVTATVIKVPC